MCLKAERAPDSTWSSSRETGISVGSVWTIFLSFSKELFLFLHTQHEICKIVGTKFCWNWPAKNWVANGAQHESCDRLFCQLIISCIHLVWLVLLFIVAACGLCKRLRFVRTGTGAVFELENATIMSATSRKICIQVTHSPSLTEKVALEAPRTACSHEVSFFQGTHWSSIEHLISLVCGLRDSK